MRRPRGSRQPACLAAWLLVGAAVWSAHARADSAPGTGPSLSWVRLPGAEGCIAQVELAARIEARLGRSAFVRPNDAIVMVEGRVAPVAQGFEAVIALSDRAGHTFGERVLTLQTGDCRQLDDVVALVIAVTLRGGPSGVPLPDAIARELEALFGDEPSVMDPSALPPADGAASQAAPTPAPHRDLQERVPAEREDGAQGPRWAIGLDAGMAVATGLQPSGTLAPAARLQLSLRGVGSVALAAGLALPQQTEIEDPSPGGPDGTLELRAWYAALALCTKAAHAFASTLELCGRVAIGFLHAQTDGFVKDGTQTKLWSELGPELALQAPLIAPLRARIGVSLPIRLGRPEFVYLTREGDRATAFQVAGIGLAGELALGVSLP